MRIQHEHEHSTHPNSQGMHACPYLTRAITTLQNDTRDAEFALAALPRRRDCEPTTQAATVRYLQPAAITVVWRTGTLDVSWAAVVAGLFES